MFESLAFAMGAPQQAGDVSGGGMLVQFLPLILMFVIFWFLLIRPQQKRAKAHKEMLDNLKKGDQVMTQSGLIGRILEIDDEQISLECGDAKLRMSRVAIGGLLTTDKKSKSDKNSEKGSKETKKEAKDTNVNLDKTEKN